MTQQDINTAPTTELNSRLALVEYSTLPMQKAEGLAIKAELVKRIEAHIARQAGLKAARRVAA